MPSPTAATTTLIQTSHHSVPTGSQSDMIPLLQNVSKHSSNSLNSHSGRGTPPQPTNAHYSHQQGTNNMLRGPSPTPGPSHLSITPVRFLTPKKTT